MVVVQCAARMRGWRAFHVLAAVVIRGQCVRWSLGQAPDSGYGMESMQCPCTVRMRCWCWSGSGPVLVRWEATWEAFSERFHHFGSRTQGWSWHELNQTSRVGCLGDRARGADDGGSSASPK